MANVFQQQARTRKLIYTAIILALFTASLMHRRLVVEPAAEDLQLREVSRGEVELTSSAVRLTLTGSRGLAVTMLWWQALQEQDRHKWNEVELLVGSITKLQPYFVTPWLFQSWNLAFNVSVENDKPRDKYYYVSRGLQLLAEGERRNQGTFDSEGRPRFPGNPDMRYHLAFTYQLKIGTSDEKHAMQCLLDLSCIDPAKRDPDKLSASSATGRDVDLKAFEAFCRDHPRLVRRLSETLDYNTPKLIVAYLKDNYVLPARFTYDKKTLSGESVLELPRAQFPIVPYPPQGPSYPNPESREFSREALDVFLLSRTWFSYAQLPLPPPFKNPGVDEPPFDPVHDRLPRNMTTMIFRGAPARAQGYIAERLEEEGWFDQEGWFNREWFEAQKGPDEELAPFGTEPKYSAVRAWNAAHKMYLDFGVANGLYVTAAERRQLNEEAGLFRKKFGATAQDRLELRKDQQVGAIGKSWRAHQKLSWNDHYRLLTNFDDHLYEAEAEADPRTVRARRLFFEAKQLARSGESPRALYYYELALPLWLNVLLQYPRFASIQTLQEDTYEAEIKYLRLLQADKAAFLRPLTLGMAQLASFPPWPWDQLMTAGEKVRIIPIRNFRGPIDSVVVLNLDHAKEVKETLLLWSQAALPLPLLVYPGQQNLLLASAAFLVEPIPGSGWQYLLSPQSIQLVRDRVGLNRKKQ